MTDCSVVDRRMLPGLLAGLVGLALGVTAAVADIALLGIAAAACALFAGGASVFLLQQLQESERNVAGVADEVTMRHLEILTSQGNRSVIDDETGLPDRRYFELVLDGRVASARRHLWPVTLVLVELWFDRAATTTATPATAGTAATTADVPADPASADPASAHPVLPASAHPVHPASAHPVHPAEAQASPGTTPVLISEVLADFALLVHRTLREADIACRLSDNTFGLILDDTSEEGGVWAAERLQIGLARNGVGIQRMAAGVASYPTHGMRADEILHQARAALARACAASPDQGLGPVEVAHHDIG